MYGIEALKEATLITCQLAQGYSKRAEDGKVTTWEWVTFIPKLLKLKDVLTNLRQIWLELTDLTELERAELEAWVAQQLGKTIGKTRRIIVKSFNLLLALGSLADELDDD